MARLLSGNRRLAVAGVVIALCQAVLLIPIAVIVREIFDKTLPDGDVDRLVLLGGAILLLFVASSALALLTRRYTIRATKQAIAGMRRDLIAKLYDLPSAYFDRTDAGSLHSTIVQDSERLDVMGNGLLALVLPAATITLALTAAMFLVSPLLAALVICVVPVLILVGRPLGRHLRSHTRRWQQAFDVFSSQTSLALRGMNVVKLHGAEAGELSKREREIADLGEKGQVVVWLQSAYELMQGTFAAAGFVVVLVVGGALVADDRMSIGDLVAFYALLGLMRNQLYGVIVSLPHVISGTESLRRLGEILDEPLDPPYRGSRRISFSGSVALDGVGFGYGDELLFRQADLRVAPGETVALVGANGTGKSTVIRLIAGLYAPSEGRVLADDIQLDELDLPWLRRQLAVVIQDPLILPASVRENIAYARPEATGAEIERAAELAGARGFVESLPRGYETPVGDEGALLSGGQRQRIALARALLGNPALLMLDEPTTHLDHEGTSGLVERLGGLSKGPAILIVSHDPAVTTLASRTYALADGRIAAEQGSVAGKAG
jgi:ATP-binding cassette subfamily B protein